MVVFASLACTGQQPNPAPSKIVHGEGCVQAGVEAGCLVAKDMKSGKLYNLLIKGTRPAAGIGIEFTGAPFEGATMCMQGAPLTVSKWTKIPNMKCAAEDSRDQ